MTDREVRLRALELALENGGDLTDAETYADFILGEEDDDSEQIEEVQAIVARLHELLSGE